MLLDNYLIMLHHLGLSLCGFWLFTDRKGKSEGPQRLNSGKLFALGKGVLGLFTDGKGKSEGSQP